MVRHAVLISCLGVILVFGGCVAPLLIAGAAPVGAAAARSGTAAYSNGRLRVARYATLEESWHATQSALNELGLEVHTERQGDRRWYVMARDENRYPEMKIHLDRRSPVMTRFSIRVGVLGDPSVSNLLMRHIDLVLQEIREKGDPVPSDRDA